MLLMKLLEDISLEKPSGGATSLCSHNPLSGAISLYREFIEAAHLRRGTPLDRSSLHCPNAFGECRELLLRGVPMLPKRGLQDDMSGFKCFRFLLVLGLSWLQNCLNT